MTADQMVELETLKQELRELKEREKRALLHVVTLERIIYNCVHVADVRGSLELELVQDIKRRWNG